MTSSRRSPKRVGAASEPSGTFATLAASASDCTTAPWHHSTRVRHPSYSGVVTVSRLDRSQPAHAAQQGKTIGLLWVDAHADMNTPSTTLSGNVHGMPLAAILGPEPSELSQIGPESPKVDPSRTVLLGVRDLDSAEKDRVLESGVHVFTMKEIDQAGLAAVAARAVSIASRGTSGIHVSFDLDVCDPSIAPGVGTPVKGGLNYREAHTVMEVISDSGALLSLDVVEANPILDTRNMTAQLGVELVLSALGKSVL